VPLWHAHLQQRHTDDLLVFVGITASKLVASGRWHVASYGILIAGSKRRWQDRRFNLIAEVYGFHGSKRVGLVCSSDSATQGS